MAKETDSFKLQTNRGPLEINIKQLAFGANKSTNQI